MVWNVVCSTNKAATESKKQRFLFSGCIYFVKSKVCNESAESINIKYYSIQCHLSLQYCKSSYLDGFLSLRQTLWSACFFLLVIPCHAGTFHSCKCVKAWVHFWIYIFEQKGEGTACDFAYLKVIFSAQIAYLGSFYYKKEKCTIMWQPSDSLRNTSYDLVSLLFFFFFFKCSKCSYL